MRTTIHDVARAAGTSTTTVSRALNGTGRVAPHTRRAVIDAARDLDYRPGDHPVPQVTYTFAVVVSDITNPFFSELLEAISQTIGEAGSLMLVAPASTWATLTALRRQKIDGLILIGTDIGADRLAAVTAGVPVVALDRDVGLATASVVRSDHEGGGRIAAEHLLSLGHRQIALITGPTGMEVARRRRAGVETAMAAADNAIDGSWVISGDFDEPSGYQAMTHLLAGDYRHRPTAVVVSNDLMGLGALAAIEAHGLSVPHDISVIGFDDVLLASYSRPKLTTIRQHTSQLGMRAARLVYDMARGGASCVPVQEVLPVELVVRESTAAPQESHDEHR